MKRIFLTILFLCCLFCLTFGLTACNSGGDDGTDLGGNEEVDEIEYVAGTEGLSYRYTGNSYACSGMGTATETDIVIATHYEGLRVTSIDNWAFVRCDTLNSVKIPETVTSIGELAFSHCSNLKNIVIPDSVTSMGDNVFLMCTSLEYATLGSGLTALSESVFDFCRSLKNITIPDSVTSIGDYAFSHCENLEDVKIPDSATSIGVGAFFFCESLTSIQIPDRVTSIGAEAFAGCYSFENVSVSDGNTAFHDNGNCVIETATKTLNFGCDISTIPDDGSVTSIGDSAFAYCNFTSIEIPDSVISIDEAGFHSCINLTIVELPNNLTSIGAYAFANANFESIIIPDSVTTIGEYAFGGCNHLKSIIIGSGVTTIVDQAFYGAYLEKVYYKGTAEEWTEISIDDTDTNLISATLYYYSEENPFVGGVEEGDFWHYVDDEIEIWTKDGNIAT